MSDDPGIELGLRLGLGMYGCCIVKSRVRVMVRVRASQGWARDTVTVMVGVEMGERTYSTMLICKVMCTRAYKPNPYMGMAYMQGNVYPG